MKMMLHNINNKWVQIKDDVSSIELNRSIESFSKQTRRKHTCAI